MNKFGFTILLFGCLVLATKTQGAVLDSLGLIELKGKTHVRYMSSKGETLYGICQRWQTSPADLIDMNPTLEKGLKAGQLIYIPYLPDKIKAWNMAHGKSSRMVSAPVLANAPKAIAPIATPKAVAPKAVAPMESPKVVAPIESPKVAAPVESPKVVAPIESPKVVAPVESPKVVAPIESPKVVAVATSQTKPEPVPPYHVVAAGQTLYAIGRLYKISAKDLQNWNPAQLSIGQKVALNAQSAKELALINQNLAQPKPKIDTIQDTFFVKKPENIATTKPPLVAPKPETQPNPLDPIAQAGQPTDEDNNEALVVVATAPIASPAQQQPTPAQAQQDAEFSFTGQYDQVPEAYYPIDGTKRILLVPFDLYLYFSDADDEIATRSKVPRTKIRQYFRRRLDVLIDPPGYETIHLLGGSVRDSLLDLDRIYRSLSYSYQEFLYPETTAPDKDRKQGLEVNQKQKSWAQKQKDKVLSTKSTKAVKDKNESKYYGVKIKDPKFFTYFNTKYGVKYYVFINQFEVKTNYENCIDRARQNYERNFIVHFSIFDDNGKQIAGNKVKIYYESNSNSIMQIVADNMEKISQAILSQLPPA